jgi:hypothetical protein
MDLRFWVCGLKYTSFYIGYCLVVTEPIYKANSANTNLVTEIVLIITTPQPFLPRARRRNCVGGQAGKRGRLPMEGMGRRNN